MLKTNDHPQLSPAEIKAKAAAWFESQIAIQKARHGDMWPSHREWVEGYIKEELRQRLMVLGWRPKR
jgi:hypothetical protein